MRNLNKAKNNNAIPKDYSDAKTAAHNFIQSKRKSILTEAK